jgi:hypothetical protein
MAGLGANFEYNLTRKIALSTLKHLGFMIMEHHKKLQEKIVIKCK